MHITPARRRRLVPALVLVPALAAALTVAVVTPAAATTGNPTATQKAGDWLAGQLTDAGTVVNELPGAGGQGTVYTDWGQSLDAAFGLLAAGGHDVLLGRTLTSVATPTAVIEYTQGAPFDKAGSAYAGATAKLAFALEVTGGDATSAGGVDLLAQLQSLVTPQGRLADRSDFGNYANLFGHAFALLALDTAGRTPSASLVQGLTAAQCADGSFPEAYEPKAGEQCKGSVDATGLALQALAALDLAGGDPAQRAKTWLQGQLKADGSFPGQAPVNSTAYAALGLTAMGVDTGSSVGYLAGQQNADGGLRSGAASTTTSDLFATAQALPALAGTTFQGSARTIARQPIPCATAVVTLPESTITATAPARAVVQATSGTTVDLFAYSRPGTTFERVRTTTVSRNGSASLTLRPGTNTRLYAQQQGCSAGQSTVLNVRTALTLAAKRTGTRDYTFSGASLPARDKGLIVSLYRLTADGGSVLTAQTRADEKTGAWTLRRAFTGSGRFDFVVRTGQDLQNAPGSSNTRSRLVY
jgi:hypothetical protein